MGHQCHLLDGMRTGMFMAYETLIPPIHIRKPFSLSTLPNAVLGPAIPFLLLAYLSRRADTRLIRLLLLPLAVWSALYFTYCYMIDDPSFRAFQFFRQLMGFYIVGKSLNLAFVRDGIFKVGEQTLRRVGDPRSQTAGLQPGFLPPSLCDAFELAFTMRGTDWDFGHEVYVPRRVCPTQRGAFLRMGALSFLKNFLIMDFYDSLVKLVPGVGYHEGGTIFLPSLPLPWRYILSTTVHVVGGLMIVFGMEAGNDLMSLIAVGLFRDSPVAWFPLYDYPWRATSLHQFWGQGWHQILRHMFLSFGGYPGQWLAGKVGLILGTFLASGLYHEAALGMFDHRILLFFLLQGVGVILENAYRRWAGRRVEGVAGWFWTVLWIVVMGQILSDAWAVCGLPGATFIPRQLSFFRRSLFPIIRSVVRWIY